MEEDSWMGIRSTKGGNQILTGSNFEFIADHQGYMPDLSCVWRGSWGDSGPPPLPPSSGHFFTQLAMVTFAPRPILICPACSIAPRPGARSLPYSWLAFSSPHSSPYPWLALIKGKFLCFWCRYFLCFGVFGLLI